MNSDLVIQGTRLLVGIQHLDSLIRPLILQWIIVLDTSEYARLSLFFISYEIFFFRMLKKKKKKGGRWHTSLLPKYNGHYQNVYCEPDVVTHIFHHCQNYFHRFCIVHAF